MGKPMTAAFMQGTQNCTTKIKENMLNLALCEVKIQLLWFWDEWKHFFTAEPPLGWKGHFYCDHTHFPLFTRTTNYSCWKFQKFNGKSSSAYELNFCTNLFNTNWEAPPYSQESMNSWIHITALKLCSKSC